MTSVAPSILCPCLEPHIHGQSHLAPPLATLLPHGYGVCQAKGRAHSPVQTHSGCPGL